MTDIAGLVCRQVATGFTGSGAAVVVAGDAAARRDVVVVERGRNPGSGAMTGVTRRGGLYVI